MATTMEVNGVCSAALVTSTCKDSFFTVVTRFLDAASVAMPLDALPTLVVVEARTGVQKISSAMTSGAGSGVYDLALNIDGWNAGLYRFTASGTITGGTVPVRLEGAFNVFEPTVDQTLVYRVKSRLFDLDARLYKLDLPVPKWNDDMIYQELLSALTDFNGKPPAIAKNYSLSSVPRPDLIIQFAFAQSLLSASILENWNTYTMGDGSANLTINRATFLQGHGTAALQRYDTEATAFSRAWRPRVRGQGTALFPLQIRRAIGFLPNMKQVFGP
jgi:hypothetical protein